MLADGTSREVACPLPTDSVRTLATFSVTFLSSTFLTSLISLFPEAKFSATRALAWRPEHCLLKVILDFAIWALSAPWNLLRPAWAGEGGASPSVIYTSRMPGAWLVHFASSCRYRSRLERTQQVPFLKYPIESRHSSWTFLNGLGPAN